MHRCLRVPELLDIIFQKVQIESGGNSAVIALACTARCFQDAALDTLWQSQASLVPLVKCFPEALLTETKVEDGSRELSFVKDPEPEDWARVAAYAARIRAIRLDPYSYPSYYGILQLAGSALETLHRLTNTTPLLPNLRSFEWTHAFKIDSHNVASLLLYLSPQVSSMDILLAAMSEQSAKVIADALCKFSENPAQLRTIRIVSPPCPPVEQAILELGLRQQHLQQFQYTWENEMTLATVSHLSTLNNLQQVSIRANAETSRGLLELAQTRGGQFFPALQFFSLYTDTLTVCEAWLRTLRHPGISNLTFTVNTPPPSAALCEFFVKLAQHSAHGNLRDLRFVSTTPCAANEHGLHLVHPDTLSPLLQLNLKSLKLEPGGPIQLDDDFVARMARAWPELRILELNAEWRRYVVPQVTLAGLIPLARHCPDVQLLALPVSTDVSAFQERYEAGYRPTGGVSFNRCFIVGVGPSMIDEQADQLMIAGFLSDLCPDLVAVQTSWTKRGVALRANEAMEEENEEMGEIWKQVERYAREMARVRRQERMWMEVS
ncbi:hypothetical protein C8Q80DRAFT_1095709 [Daedaleopsis nitida]|nr:hypothetical protein C8Q80DRAFT_1095709 [Daedaleopsis nitida]